MGSEGKLKGKNYECGKWAKLGVCKSCGTVYAMEIFCGKEWCDNCREKMEQRRFGRLHPKIYTWEDGFAYLIITIPEKMRDHFLEKENLSKLRTYLRRKLKRIYPDLQAVARWHFFDTEKNRTKYHPHFNVLIRSLGWIDPQDLAKLKEDYKRFLERETGMNVCSKTNLGGKVDLRYQFYSSQSIKEEFLKVQSRQKKRSKVLKDKHIKRMRNLLQAGWSLEDVCQEMYERIRAHKLKYVVRATFLIYQKTIASKLKGFRNSSSWGKFRSLTNEEKEKINFQVRKEFKGDVRGFHISRGECPFCHGKIKWMRSVGRHGLVDSVVCLGSENLGQGYWMVSFGSRDSPVVEKVVLDRKELADFRSYRGLVREMSENKWRGGSTKEL